MSADDWSKRAIIKDLKELIVQIEAGDIIVECSERKFAGTDRLVRGTPNIFTLYYHNDELAQQRWKDYLERTK